MSGLLWYSGHELLVRDIVRAEGCSLYDEAGTRYVDLESGVWCTPLGHGHPEVRRALSEQAARIAHTGFGYSNPTVEEAGREVLSLLGFEGGKTIFLCSGSEAVEYGVRVAQSIGDHPLLMTMTDSYFGAYGSARRREADEWHNLDWSPCAECPAGRPCDERCKHWSAIPWEGIAGFLFEPGSSSGLVRFPPEKLIHGIARAVEASEGLLLVNEVTTGIGRTGSWFGYQHYDLTPDIVALGKGLGNGYPVSVTAVSPRVAERLATRPVPYAQSHQNDPLGAAVVRAVLRVIREKGLIQRGREVGAQLLAGLERIQARTGRIREIRARGMMIAIDLGDDPECSLAIHTHRELVRRGFVLARRPGLNVLRLDPPLTIEEQDVAAFLTSLEEVLSAGRAG